MSSYLSHLECGNCGHVHDAFVVQTVCDRCGGPLLARYNLADLDLAVDQVKERSASQFRFHEVLPTDAGAKTPTLGEGATPLLHAAPMGPNLFVKDEAQNPTGSFKARGMAVAMARAVELGLTRFALPSNGNAGGAAAAYGALYGVDVHVVVPDTTPKTLIEEPEAYGAAVTIIDGTIADAGKMVAEMSVEEGVFNLATLREPFRVEGKKMMGYELFWDLGRLPDVVIYPTGGGTGLVGMVKAWDEMQELGWIGTERPRMVAVQVDGCAPIVKAFHDNADYAEPWVDPVRTAAYGIRVPSAIGDHLMLEGLRQTGGTALTVTEEELLDGTERLARHAGIWGTPEGGACLAAADRLTKSGWIEPRDAVVIFNTAAAGKYA